MYPNDMVLPRLMSLKLAAGGVTGFGGIGGGVGGGEGGVHGGPGSGSCRSGLSYFLPLLVVMAISQCWTADLNSRQSTGFSWSSPLG